MRDGLYTAREAAARIGITPSAVLNWANRGYETEHGETMHLPVRGHTGRRVKLFLWSEIREAERATRRKRNRSHRRRTTA